MMNTKFNTRFNNSSKFDRKPMNNFPERYSRYGKIINTTKCQSSSKSLIETPKKPYFDVSACTNVDRGRQHCTQTYNKFTNNNYSPTTARVRFDTNNIKYKNRTKSLPDSVKMRSERSNQLHPQSKLPISKNQIEQENDELKTLFNIWLKEALLSIQETKPKIGQKRSEKSDSVDDSKELLKVQTGGDTVPESSSNSKSRVKSELLKLNDFCRSFLKDSRMHKGSIKQITQMYDILDRITTLLKAMKKKSQKNNSEEIKSSSGKPQKPHKELCGINKSSTYDDFPTETDLSSIDNYTISSKNDKIDLSKTKSLSEIKDAKTFANELRNHDKKLIEQEIVNSKPVFSNYDKKLLGEIISYPKVTIHSQCIIGIHEKIVEEQFVIRTFRYLSEQEKCNHLNDINKGIKLDWNKQYANNNDIDHTLNKKSEETQTLINEPLSNNILNKMLKTAADDVESLSWESENLLHDFNLLNLKANHFDMHPDTVENEIFNRENEILSNVSKNAISPMICEETNLESSMPNHIDEELNIDLNFDENFTSNIEDILLYAGITDIDTKLHMTDDITHVTDSFWTVHGTKIRNLTAKASVCDTVNLLEPETLKQPLLDHFYRENNKSLTTKTPTKRLPPCIPLSMRNSKPQKSPVSNPSSHTTDLSVVKIDDTIKDLLNDKDIQLPENLSCLYDRLSKLQKILECIPEERITSTLDALEQLDCSSISSHDIRNITEENTESTVKPEEKKPEPKVPEGTDDIKSDVTPSLSMLENLIDDFLSKNGLTNLVGT